MTDVELFSIEAMLETKPENPTWAQYLRVVRHCLRLRADLRQRHTVEVCGDPFVPDWVMDLLRADEAMAEQGIRWGADDDE